MTDKTHAEAMQEKREREDTWPRLGDNSSLPDIGGVRGIPVGPLVRVEPCLRDQFAMAALTGLFAADVEDTLTTDKAAEVAYRTADAMLEERGK